MKKILLFGFIISTLVAFGQDDLTKSNVKTTESEYNFLLMQYAKDKSITILEGYELKPFAEKTSGDFYFNYQFLVELETENVKAIFIEITKVKSSKKDKLRYLCAPFNNPLLTTKFNKDVQNLESSMYFSLIDVNMNILGRFIDDRYNNGQTE